MSYDLVLFRPRPGETVEQARSRALAPPDIDPADPDALPFGPLDADVDSLVTGLVGAVSNLERFDAPGLVELTEPSLGFQITFMGSVIHVSIPFWYDGAEAVEVLATVGRALDTLHRTGGYAVHDSQSEKLLDGSDGYRIDAASYEVGRAVVRDLEAR
ncbi:MAG: hypothetical protein R3F34_18835 [Planctomycetota bacterium]